MTPTIPIVAPCICGDPTCVIPHGLCHCGCGEKTNVAIQNNSKSGEIKGWPKKFINTHQAKKRPVFTDEPVFYVDGDPCRAIPLTQGQVAIVDAKNYEMLMKYKWFAVWERHTFYAKRNSSMKDGKVRVIRMHRQIAKTLPGEETDHRNGNGLDNRERNLRPANPTQQRQNSKTPITNTSGCKGVSLCLQTGLYKVRIKINGKDMWLGRHPYDKAVELRRQAEKDYQGEWRRQ